MADINLLEIMEWIDDNDVHIERTNRGKTVWHMTYKVGIKFFEGRAGTLEQAYFALRDAIEGAVDIANKEFQTMI